MKNFHFVLAILSLLLFNSDLFSQQWIRQTNPLGTGEQAMLGRVEFVSQTEGWISGSRGTLLHTTDAGANWLIVNPWPTDTLWSGSDPGHVMDWVGISHGWKLDNLGPDYGVSTKVFLHKTTDGGINWTRKILSSEVGDFGFKLQFVDQNNGWVLIWNFTTMVPKFLRTTDGGENWTNFNGMGIFFFVTPNIGWCYSSTGPNMTAPFKIYKTTNGGNNWIEQLSEYQPGMYNDIFFIDQNNGWLVGDSGKVIKTKDGGVSWSYVTNSGINSNEKSKTIFFVDINNGWIPSKTDDPESAFIQHTTDGGNTWTTQNLPLGSSGKNSVFSIYFTNINNGWLVADHGKICKYSSTTDVRDESLVNDFALYQNYPNPFNPTTRIKFTIPGSVEALYMASLRVYDILGKEVATLVNEEKTSGTYEIEFNASFLHSGIYFYRLNVGSFSSTRKLVFIK